MSSEKDARVVRVQAGRVGVRAAGQAAGLAALAVALGVRRVAAARAAARGHARGRRAARCGGGRAARRSRHLELDALVAADWGAGPPARARRGAPALSHSRVGGRRAGRPGVGRCLRGPVRQRDEAGRVDAPRGVGPRHDDRGRAGVDAAVLRRFAPGGARNGQTRHEDERAQDRVQSHRPQRSAYRGARTDGRSSPPGATRVFFIARPRLCTPSEVRMGCTRAGRGSELRGSGAAPRRNRLFGRAKRRPKAPPESGRIQADGTSASSPLKRGRRRGTRKLAGASLGWAEPRGPG